MITYAIQVSFSWVLLYLIYACFLQKESFFGLNRMYLLLSLVGGLLLPFIEIETGVADWSNVSIMLEEISVGAAENLTNLTAVTQDTWSWNTYLGVVYFIGVLFCLVRMFVELLQIRKLYKEAVIEKFDDYCLVKTNEPHSPFSFGHYLFISNQTTTTAKGLQYILEHELAHINQYHTLDIVLAEILHCLFWFNPLILLFKNALRDQHEYLADQAVLNHAPIKEYGQLLIEQSVTGLNIGLANHLIYSQLKKRINMMTKKHSSRFPFIKYALSLSAFMFVFWSVSCQQQSSTAMTENAEDTPQMPYLASCKSDVSSEEIQQCSNLKLMTFVGENLKYPATAKEKKIEGMAVISFTINEKGLVDKVTIVKDLEEGCGAEAARIVNLMNDQKMVWIPGQKDGKAVATELKLPVRFKLQ